MIGNPMVFLPYIVLNILETIEILHNPFVGPLFMLDTWCMYAILLSSFQLGSSSITYPIGISIIYHPFPGEMEQVLANAIEQ
jgi:hypothetical protein